MLREAVQAFAVKAECSTLIYRRKRVEAKRECLSCTCRTVSGAQTLVKWTKSKPGCLCVTFSAFISSPHHFFPTYISQFFDDLHTAAADALFPAVTDMKYTGCVCVRSCILQRALMHV